jgi:hypothetical protein
MKTITTLLVLLGSNTAYAQQGTLLYDANGRVIGRAVPSSQGSVNYYNSKGQTTGHSTHQAGRPDHLL